MRSIDNVIIVVIDALRADRVGCLDGKTGLTPYIDSLAEDGTAFSRAFACASNTDPSMTSLLTGRYPLKTVYHHGKLVTQMEKQRIEEVAPLPGILSDNGWFTATVGHSLGRWHARGFDYYPTSSAENSFLTRLTNSMRGLFDQINQRYPQIGSKLRDLYNLSNRGMKPDVVMQDHNPTKLLNKVGPDPFFGVIHLMETHKPYLATTDDFRELVRHRNYPNESTREFLENRDVTDAQYRNIVESVNTLGLERPGDLIALYDAAVRYADRKVGQLIEALRGAGIKDRTAIFVTADHGESLFEHGIYLSHHGLYEDVFRVPIVCDIGNGNRVTQLIQLTDIAPTILDLVGIEGPEMDGKSLIPLLSDEGGWQDRTQVFGEEAYYQRRTCVRTEKWKYIFHTPDSTIESQRGSSLECDYCDTIHGDNEELYNLQDDPDELHDVKDDYPDVVDDLSAAYEKHISGLIKPKYTLTDIRYEDEEDVLDRLEAIGYR